MKKQIKNKKIFFGCAVLLMLLICLLLADLLAPHDPAKINLDMRYASRSAEYPLGADAYGRCIFSRLMFGARYSVGLSLLIMCLVIVSALPISMAAAYRGGLAEKLLLLLCDISMALPPTVLVLSTIGVLGQGMVNLIFATVFSYWGWYAKMVRSYVLLEKGKGYVPLAVTGGSSAVKILTRHIFPNILPNLLVLFALGIGDILLTISGFSFLGIALPSGTPEWGAMLSEARGVFLQSPEYALYPGLCVLITVCGFNLLGEGLGHRMSPFEEVKSDDS